ncbi:MAG TPA: hypothetical protein VE998_10055 [Terriglobales bacterium]|nr:hypothetical protein [Terriglobales bacterium]
MAIVVIGGHSRNVGKTSLVCGLVAAMSDCGWTAVKITQFGHGVCSRHGEPCDCAPAELDHAYAIDEEHDRSGRTDTSRYLAAGARRALWVRTRQGKLAEAMPELRGRLAQAANIIIESNSVMQFLRPDVYLSVLDPQTEDFKDSARLYLDRADALVVHAASQAAWAAGAKWNSVSLKPAANKPQFSVAPPTYCTAEIVEFVRRRLQLGEPRCAS